ncbi:hypothetical protein D9M70_623510 [compost metagenome]
MNVAFAFLIQKTGWIFAREIVIGEGGCLRITRLSANGFVKTVNRKESQRIRTDIPAHGLKAVMLVCQQFFTVRRIDAVEVRMEDHRACNADMHFLRTCIADHLHDLDRSGAAYNGIIHQNDALAFDHCTVG